jgi:hypothetical protein
MSRERAHPVEGYRLLAAAGVEAEALGSRSVGPEDFILAILASEDRPPALVALEDCGSRHDGRPLSIAGLIARSINLSGYFCGRLLSLVSARTNPRIEVSLKPRTPHASGSDVMWKHVECS